ncbi:X-linked retinitis pigmentosa GTPase regulator-like [Lycorma delicatula]|uniref:X-linked retinitis pigmentosa GTPase regulator-like n=1 Tax=Lycorma delicatula TaxID=130591 RepID=UPI003F510B6A
MDSEVENDIPITGAVFTFGESSFADNCPSHFFIRNDPIIDIACGEEHTIVVCQNGRVFGFGGNGYGQVGLGHTNRVIKPSCVKSLKPDRVCLVACGQYHTLIYTETGFVYGWGNNSDGQLGLSENDICESKLHPSLTETDSIACSVKQISAGSCHSVLLTLDGRVYVWGSNQHGQLGLGDGIKKSGVPVLLPAPDDVVQISCGLYHTMLLSYDGKVFIFGHGESGKLGLGGNNSVPFPIPVGFDELSSQINGIAAGGNYSMAFAEDGTVYAWGNNDHGQLGLEREEMKEINKPTIVSLLRTVYVKKVICGYRHTAFITDKHELYMCGETTSGKLCLDNEETEIYINKALLPAKVTKFKDCIVEKVACGGRHTMVLAAAAEKFIDKQEIISAPSDASKSCVTIPDVTDVNNTSEENNDHSSHTPSEFPSPLPPKNIPSNNSSPNNSMKYNTHGSIINGNNNDAVSVNSVASSSKKDDDRNITNDHINIADRKTNIESPESSSKHLQNMNNSKEESFSESKRDEEESTSKRDDPKDKKKNSFRANGVPPNGITRGHQKNSRMCVIL